MYVNLLTRSHYSIGMSSISIDDMISFSLNNHLEYVSLIDHNVMYGALEFYTKAIAAKLKPIIGITICFNNQQIILIARNYSGYLQLCNISSIINHQQKLDLLTVPKSDLIAICDLPIKGFYKCYLTKQLAIHEALFVNCHDYDKYKALLAINENCLYSDVKDNKTIVQKYLYDENKAKQEFTKSQIDETNKLICSIDLKIDLNNQNHFVVFDKKHNSANLLQERCRQGLINKFGQKVDKKYIDRIKYELDIIHKMGFDDYFLVVQDYVAYAKQNNIMVGPGRGSAAGSLVSYVLAITNIDPIKYHLLFERFLNPFRKTKPDIDLDFMDSRRQEVFDYIFNKYGKQNVAHIITFQKIKIKTAIRDIARILDLPLSIVNLICKSITDWSDDSIDDLAKSNAILQKYIEKYPLLFDLAKFIIGLPRQIGTHAAGVVICNEPLQNVLPTTLSPEGLNTTQYSMEYIEACGLIKMDILGLVNLSIINDCVNAINSWSDKSVNIDAINLDDKKVFQQLCLGNTIGIFQLESPGMTKVVQKIHPQSIEDISIASALFRPGPQANIPLYLANKKNPEKIKYIDQRLASILQPTFGIIIYQEQVIQTLCIVANWSLAQADIVRRAISKKKIAQLYELENNFVQAAIKNNFSKEKSQEIFSYLIKFASYGFNHSHSIAYALISYQLAYLKTYYPKEFYACLLTYNNNSLSKISQYLLEAKKNAITILPPSINYSQYGFSLHNKQIIFSLSGLKGLGSETIAKILQARKKIGHWDDLKQCFKDLVANGINQSVLLILAKAGAFDELLNKDISNRISLCSSIEEIYSCVKLYSDKYGFLKSINYTIIPTSEQTIKQENDWQFNILGFSFSKHPILAIKQANKDLQFTTLSDILTNGKNNDSFFVIAYINSVKKLKTKTGVDMAFISLEDESMLVTDAVCFGSILTSIKEGSLLIKNNFLYLQVTKTSRSIKIIHVLKELKN